MMDISKMATGGSPQSDPAVPQFENVAAVSKAHNSTFRLIDLTEKTAGGTAVAVRLASHYFLATAAHVIPSNHKMKIVLRDAIEGNHVSTFVARHTDEAADIGLLELDAKDAKKFEDVFVTKDWILPRIEQSKLHDVTVIGYPGQLLRNVDRRCLAANATLEVHRCDAFTFQSFTLPLSEWPTKSLQNPPDKGRDIFIDYDPEQFMCKISLGTAGDKPPVAQEAPPHPAGISGGGIWILNPNASPGIIWKPDAFLLGIQFGMHREDKWLRGTLIDIWLDLVWNNYLDLRTTVSNIKATI